MVHEVGTIGVVPSFVEHDVRYVIFRSEIDIIFICSSIDSCLEINTFQVPVAPPVPRYFSRTNPRNVANLIGSSKRIYKVVDRHLSIVGSYGKHTPRIGALTNGLGYERLTFCNVRHSTPLMVIHTLGVLSKDSGETIIRCLHEHTRITAQVALEQGYLHIAY